VAAEHPAYLHALADLRDARAHLERRPGAGDARVKWDERAAIKEIDEAMREIKAAAVWDGKNILDHMPVDEHMEYGGRLRRAVELLRKAESDCREDRDRSFAGKMQERAIEHIHEAIRLTMEGIEHAR
jgi:ribosomal 50S subunit-associated protein YjgA (DUF615 family)